MTLEVAGMIQADGAVAPAGEKPPPSGQQQNVVMEPSLGKALERIFGSTKKAAAKPPASAAAASAASSTAPPAGSGAPPAGSSSAAPPGAPPAASSSAKAALPPGTRALIDQADKEFQAAQKALKAGDFAGYGRHIKAVEKTLGKLKSGQ